MALAQKLNKPIHITLVQLDLSSINCPSVRPSVCLSVRALKEGPPTSARWRRSEGAKVWAWLLVQRMDVEAELSLSDAHYRITLWRAVQTDVRGCRVRLMLWLKLLGFCGVNIIIGTCEKRMRNYPENKDIKNMWRRLKDWTSQLYLYVDETLQS